MHRLFIVNPNASMGKALSKIESMRLYEHGRVVLTRYPGHAEEIAKEGGYDEIIAVGGDGTAHEVLNGVLKSGQDPVFSAIPGGTGNDFLRNFSLSSRRNRELMKIDVGYIEELDEYFLNTADIGFSSQVVRYTVAKPFRKLTYVASIFANLIKMRPEWMDFSVGNMDFSGYFFQVDICNGRYYGGGMKISPHSCMKDGLFNIIMSRPIDRTEVVYGIIQIYHGRHLKMPYAKELTSREIKVYSRNWINADGEIVGETPATFRNLKRRLKLRIFQRDENIE